MYFVEWATNKQQTSLFCGKYTKCNYNHGEAVILHFYLSEKSLSLGLVLD